MAKQLSNGTLALKFMQRKPATPSAGAPRSGANETRVELKRAAIADDSAWDVGQAVRETWGLARGGQSGSTSTQVVYESSYLPFLYGDSSSTDMRPEDEEDSEMSQPPRLTGRWNNLPEKEPKVIPATTPLSPGKEIPDTFAKQRSILSSSKMPVTSKIDAISARPSKGSKKEKDSVDRKGKRKATDADTAEDVIDSAIQEARSMMKSATPAGAQGFLRPGGIDSPAPISSARVAPRPNSSVQTESIGSAPKPKKKRKVPPMEE